MSTPEKKAFWLIKFAPFRTSWAEIVRRGSFAMRGVRNPEARNNLAAMRPGDRVLYYHSQREMAVVGVLEVSGSARPDPTSSDPRWLTCDFRPVKTLARPVPLAKIKTAPALATFPLVHRPRLAVMPVAPAEFDAVLALSEEAP
ncbi:MAG: EVE domain-containing protein [Lentisphaerae bacterium]|nr:EVE domain-containing protein [Lentisphaerota bacterium]